MALRAGVAFVDVLPDVSKFGVALTSQMRAVSSSAGRSLSRVGTLLGGAVTVGLVAAAGAATKASLSYERAFTRIAAITNSSQEQVAAWKTEVLGLAQETAVAPQRLADALFFLSSAGLQTSQVMEALDASARATAVGLGETTDLAKIAANVLNAYADSGITATEVFDVLTAGVRESTAETDEFAGALGRILPIASRAGVSFDEVVASLASLSNIGLDVNEGVTAMRSLLNALVAPGTQAARALEGIGISADQMREVISEQGILGALQLLEERTGGNIDVLRKIIPNIRALTGELGLTGENAEKVAGVFDRVANSSGSLGRAFDETARGPMFQLEQAGARLQSRLIETGRAFIPMVTAAARLAGALSPLVGLLPVVAAQIIAIQVAGRLLPALLLQIGLGLERLGAARIASGIGNLAGGLQGLVGVIGGVVAVLGTLAVIQAQAAEQNRQFGENVRTKLIPNLRVFQRDGESLADTAERLGLSHDAFAQALIFAGVSLDELDGKMRAGRTETERMIPAMQQLAERARAGGDAVVEVSEALGEMPRNAGRARGVLDLLGMSFGELRAAAEEAASPELWDEFVTQTLGRVRDALADWRSQVSESLTNVAGIFSDLANKAHLSADEVLSAFRRQRRIVQEFTADLITIRNTGGETGRELAAALLQAGPAMAGVADTIASAGRRMRERLVAEFGALTGAGDRAARKLQQQLVGVLEDIRSLLEDIARAWGITITDNSDQVKARLQSLLAVANQLRVPVQMPISGGVPGQALATATGISATVRRPTWILAGEGARAEHVQVTPLPGRKSDAGSLQGLVITGTLDTPFGPAQVRGMVQREIGTDRAVRTIERGRDRHRVMRGL